MKLTVLLANNKECDSVELLIGDNEQVFFGRRATTYQCQVNEIMFTNEIVSRDHAHLTYTNGSLVLVDTGSENGTYVNGELLAPNEPIDIARGDKVQLGATDANNGDPIRIQIHYEILNEEQHESDIDDV